jgi:hypothetical protein
MRIAPQIPSLTLLLLALLGFGFWARHQAMVKDLDSIFAEGVFSPIRAQYPSVVSPEQQAAIQQREQEFKLQSEATAKRWKVLSISLFTASIIPVAALSILGRRALKNRPGTTNS